MSVRLARHLSAIGWRVLTAHGLSLACAIAGAQPPVSQGEAALELLRTAQLSQWLGEDINSAESLCIQDRYGPSWPRVRDGQPGDREQDRLRIFRDDCANTSSIPKRGLVGAARKDFVARAARLSGLREAVLACLSPPADASSQHRCLEHVVGAPLDTDDERRLVGIAGTPQSGSEAARSPAASSPF